MENLTFNQKMIFVRQYLKEIFKVLFIEERTKFINDLCGKENLLLDEINGKEILMKNAKNVHNGCLDTVIKILDMIVKLLK